MSAAKFNIPDSLEEALIAKQVVPFVGAGISRAIERKDKDSAKTFNPLFPSWKEFLVSAAMKLRGEKNFAKAKDVIKLINLSEPDYLKSAEVAKNALGTLKWNKLLNENFKRRENEADTDTLELSKLVWQLGSNLIYTTNIDDVLEWKGVIDGKVERLDAQTDEFAELQQQEQISSPTVVYLHGHISSKSNIVFTQTQYENFYDSQNNQAKLHTLHSFLTRRSFLFLGFSLDDPYFLKQMDYIHNIYKGAASSFYVLLPEWEKDNKNIPDYVDVFTFSGFGKPLLEKAQALSDIAKSADTSEKDSSLIITPKPPEVSGSSVKSPFFNVEFRSKGAEFVGRVGKIEEIWKQLNKSGCASIGQGVNVKGLGGYGKTQLAVEYAHEMRDKYKNGVYWVVADQPIETQLLTIGDALGWTANASETVNQLEAAKNGFRALFDCLILFDNVESYDGIKDYLPKHDPRTHILITSREKISKFHQFDIGLLDRDESRDLLLKIAKRNPEGDAEKAHLEDILEILGGIPLALELVGGYLAEHELITFAKYHQFLNEVPLHRLEREFPEGSFTDHDRSIIKTLRISEKTIKEKPLMVEILKVLAWSGSSSMGISLLQTLVEAGDNFEFENALNDAHKLRLLKKDNESERYTIHRLLAKVIRYENPLESQPDWHEKIVDNLEIWFRNRTNKFEYLTEFEFEIEHLETWQEKTVERLFIKSILLLQLRGNIPRQRGLYRKALDFFKKALDLYEKESLADKNLFADLQNDLGSCYGFLGKHEEALKYQLQSLEIRRELFGEEHPNTATALNNVGATYLALGKHEEALKYQLQSLEIRRESFGEKHPNTATALNNVGSTYDALGNHEEALKYKLQSLEILRESFGEKHPNTASSLNNVGFTYGALGNHEEALKYKLQSLEIRRELFGEKHPNTATALNNVGSTYDALGNHEEALKYQLQSLEILRESFGDKHPNTATALDNVGSTYGALGNHEEALKYQLQSLEIRRELFGEKHPDTASSLNNVGSTYDALGNHEEALKYQLQSLEIHRELLGNNHPNTIILVGNTLISYLKLNENEKARKLATEFLNYVLQNHPYRKFLKDVSEINKNTE